MRQYFENQLPPDLDDVAVNFMMEQDDGSLVQTTTVHPWYVNLAGLVWTGWHSVNDTQWPIFKNG